MLFSLLQIQQVSYGVPPRYLGLRTQTAGGTGSSLIHSADGNYEVTLMTKVEVRFTGDVRWEPPAIYKSYCLINVEYFPYVIMYSNLRLPSVFWSSVLVQQSYLRLCRTSRAAKWSLAGLCTSLFLVYLCEELCELSVTTVSNESFA